MHETPEVHVREEPLPGAARLFHLGLSDGWQAVVVVDDDRRELTVVPPDGEEAAARLTLNEAEAVTLATLLTGVRVVFESQPADTPAGGVHVETVIVGPASPAVGVTVHDLDVPAPDDAQVLAVIRDDTPEIVEDDRDRPCQVGDRLVLAGRPGPLAELRRFLAG